MILLFSPLHWTVNCIGLPAVGCGLAELAADYGVLCGGKLACALQAPRATDAFQRLMTAYQNILKLLA